jgi:hypothetical protein
MSNAYKTKVQIKKPKNVALVLNHQKRGILPKRADRRRGIFSQNIKEKPKPKVIKKIEKQDVSEILRQGRMKNKEDLEALLSTHGGNYKTDFGLRDTINFNDESNSGWNNLYSYVQGNVNDQRIEQTILNMK